MYSHKTVAILTLAFCLPAGAQTPAHAEFAAVESRTPSRTVSLPAELIGTVITVIAWFLVGYALYASLFATAASLVSRQEDLPSVITPLTMLMVVGFVVAIQSASNPGGTLATVTSHGDDAGLTTVVFAVLEAVEQDRHITQRNLAAGIYGKFTDNNGVQLGILHHLLNLGFGQS